MPRWLLPENISDVLPTEARAIEVLRRRLLDLYRSYGYELVVPPMLEHLDSLLTGFGGDAASRTFQLVDQLSGRTLGIRCDMTPQVARIDAHLLNRAGLARLCYAGSVLHTRPAGLFASREPLQIGAELYGHAGIEADLEVAELMIASLMLAGAGRVRVDLGHVGLVPAVLSLDPSVDAAEIYPLLRQKDRPGLGDLLTAANPEVRRALLALTELYGPLTSDAIARARALLPALPGVSAALDQLALLAASPIWQRFPCAHLSMDLADIRDDRYHTGITFAAYVDAIPNAIARGGRYDNIGRAFGRARPATGFSLELRELAGLLPAAEPAPAILAPWSTDPALDAVVGDLRAAGEIVLRMLPGHEQEAQAYSCDRELVPENDGWVLKTR